MAADLRELRAKITVETDLALEAVCRAFKRDKSDVVREVLHGWALKKIIESNVHRNLRRGEGIATAPERRDDGDETE